MPPSPTYPALLASPPARNASPRRPATYGLDPDALAAHAAAMVARYGWTASDVRAALDVDVRAVANALVLRYEWPAEDAAELLGVPPRCRCERRR